MNWVWGLNKDGLITKCYSPVDKRGKGRCNHMFFQEENESESAFVKRMFITESQIRNEYKANLTQKDNIIRISSKGVQDKFFANNCYYKTDSDGGDEGLNEEMTSLLCSYSNLNAVMYKTCTIFIDDRDTNKNGCYSENFLNDDIQEFTISSIIKREGIKQCYYNSNNIEESFDNMIKFININTHIDYSDFLLKVLSLDLITLNHDRHIENITIWKKNNAYELPLCFDNGCAFDNKIVDGDVSNPFTTFLKLNKTGKNQYYTYQEYLSLIKNKQNILNNGKPFLSIKKEVWNSMLEYENKIYTRNNVERHIKFIINRLKGTKDVLWKEI